MANPTRNRLIKLIHVARRQLAMDDPSYRANLRHVSGKTSCADMTEAELKRVLARLQQLGFVLKRTPGKPDRGPIAELRKLQAIWITMGQHRILDDASDAALNRWIARMAGVEAHQWLSRAQARRLLEALKAWHRRELLQRLAQQGRAPHTDASGQPAGYHAIIRQYQEAL